MIDKLRNGKLFELAQRTVATFVQAAVALIIMGDITAVNIWSAAGVAGGLAALKVIGEFAAVYAKDKADAS